MSDRPAGVGFAAPEISKENAPALLNCDGLALLPEKMLAETPVSERPAFITAGPSADDLTSDEALVLGIRRCDPEVGRHMYRRVIRVVEATLRRVVGRVESDHEDLVQAAFEEIVRTIHAGKFAMRCSLTSWAASITCHVGLNAIRARRMDRSVFDRQHAQDSSAAEPLGSSLAQSLERTLEARDELRQVRIALARIAPARAEAVVLHDVMGYGVKEIAAMTGSSVAALQSRLARGRADLSELLGLATTEASGQ